MSHLARTGANAPKRLFALAASAAFVACGSSTVEPRALPSAPSLRSEKVGAGFLVTEPSADVKVGVNRRGDLVSPKVTKDFQGPPTSNTWWSSLIWQYDPAKNQIVFLGALCDQIKHNTPENPVRLDIRLVKVL